MNGIELSRAYYEAHGAPMLRERFEALLPLIAVGLTGSGSECYGYDDDISRDHDFGPGFCLFLPDESRVDRGTAFQLERAYAALPRTFMGVERPPIGPVGGARRGVLRTADFFAAHAGAADGALTAGQWLAARDEALAEAVNGEIFYDGLGEVTRIRARLASYPPDIRRKKLAGCLLLMAQSGQYNYRRCLRRGETGAAQLAAIEFVHRATQAVFLLNGVYMPYYKWRFRAMRALPRLALLAEVMEYLLTTDNDGGMAAAKADVIEGIADDVIGELRRQSLTRAEGGDLEAHAYAVNDRIADAQIRNLHILAAV